MPDDEPPGRRARAVLESRRRIQAAALRLFADQGYAETSVAEVARAAGVAERTCFRHFPTKPDLVLWDSADDDLLERFRSQPADLGVIDAMRKAVRDSYTQLTAEELDQEHRRTSLMVAVPELRAAHLDHLIRSAAEFTAVVAERAHREVGDTLVRAASGAVLGILITAQYPGDLPPGYDPATAIDEALARLREALDRF